MRKITFPILDIKENRITSISGDKSYFYKLRGVDLTQMNKSENQLFYKDISTFLNNIDETSFFKFYKIGGESFLNTNLTLDKFSNIKCINQDNSLGIFFGNETHYSDIGIYNDYISFSGQYLRVFSVSSFSDIELNPFDFIGDFDFVLNFKKIKKEESIKKLERIRSGHLLSFNKTKKIFQGKEAMKRQRNF